MKRKYLLICVGLVLVCIITILLIVLSGKKTRTIDRYVIHYYSSNYIYDITTKSDYIYIEKREVVVCVQSPCYPLPIGNFKIKYTDEYMDFIEELFKDKETKELVISTNELNDEQVIIMSKLVEDNEE